MMLVGMGRYMLGMITSVGAVFMYFYGSALKTLFATWHEVLTGDFLEAAWTYYIESALPPSSVEQVIGTILLGTVIAGFKWMLGMYLGALPRWIP